MARGNNPRRSNKLMQSRVILQGVGAAAVRDASCCSAGASADDGPADAHLYPRRRQGRDLARRRHAACRSTRCGSPPIGTVDEANAAIGLARLHADAASRRDARRASRTISSISAPICARRRTAARRRRVAHPAGPGRASRARDRRDECRACSRSTPSSCRAAPPCAAYLHLARTIARRAERLVAELAVAEPVNPEALKYLNRLSDHLFVLGRHVNERAPAMCCGARAPIAEPPLAP